MKLEFLDTNIFLRHLLGDHSVQSPRATAYLLSVEQGEVKVRVSDTVIFETVFTLQRHYGYPKAAIRDNLLPLIDLHGVILPAKMRLRSVFDLYVEQNLPFADAYHAVLMESLKLSRIVSFDKEFDKIEGIERIEP
ncbi:MAG: PIN domain-containing protein [Candidatus Woykebacteria bacterium]